MSSQQIVLAKQGEEGGTYLLDVPRGLVSIPRSLADAAESEGFQAKNEYHVTVIGSDLAHRIRDKHAECPTLDLVNSFSWTFEPLVQYIELAKDDSNGVHRQSIIQLVTVPKLDQFFTELSVVVGAKLTPPPAHITLFTKNHDRGIGVYSREDLLQYKVGDLKISS